MTKKSKTPAKRRKSSAPAKTAKRRNYARRSRGLGDMLNPTIATNSAKSLFSAGAGGFGAIFANRLMPVKWGTGARLAASIGAGFLMHSVVQAPNLASGFFGGMIALNMKSTLYDNDSDNANFVNRDALKDAPLFMDDDGNVLALADDGNYYQLSDQELSELAEDIEFVEV